MAVMHGKDAKVEKNDVAVAYLQEWTIETSIEEEDITDFGDDWKAFAGGLAEWGGSMTGYFDPSNTEQKAIHDALVAAAPTGALTDLEFYLNASNYYSGSVVITGVSLSVAVSGHIKVTFTFKGNGALSYN